MTFDQAFQERFQHEKQTDAIEDILRAAKRHLPVGAGSSPVVATRFDHLAPDLRAGSAEYVEMLEALRHRGLL